MKNDDQLPPEIGAQFLSYLREVDGKFEVVDKEGLLNFIAEYSEKYPILRGLFTVNEEAVLEHFHKTGEAPPGIKIIHTSTREGDNVTKLEVFRGPVANKDSGK